MKKRKNYVKPEEWLTFENFFSCDEKKDEISSKQACVIKFIDFYKVRFRKSNINLKDNIKDNIIDEIVARAAKKPW